VHRPAPLFSIESELVSKCGDLELKRRTRPAKSGNANEQKSEQSNHLGMLQVATMSSTKSIITGFRDQQYWLARAQFELFY
jgi:hypothetical protein